MTLLGHLGACHLKVDFSSQVRLMIGTINQSLKSLTITVPEIEKYPLLGELGDLIRTPRGMSPKCQLFVWSWFVDNNNYPKFQVFSCSNYRDSNLPLKGPLRVPQLGVSRGIWGVPSKYQFEGFMGWVDPEKISPQIQRVSKRYRHPFYTFQSNQVLFNWEVIFVRCFYL